MLVSVGLGDKKYINLTLKTEYLAPIIPAILQSDPAAGVAGFLDPRPTTPGQDRVMIEYSPRGACRGAGYLVNPTATL
jgi:hypothetical protein